MVLVLFNGVAGFYFKLLVKVVFAVVWFDLLRFWVCGFTNSVDLFLFFIYYLIIWWFLGLVCVGYCYFVVLLVGLVYVYDCCFCIVCFVGYLFYWCCVVRLYVILIV